MLMSPTDAGSAAVAAWLCHFGCYVCRIRIGTAQHAAGVFLFNEGFIRGHPGDGGEQTVSMFQVSC